MEAKKKPQPKEAVRRKADMAHMGQLMNKKVHHTTQMREKSNSKNKRT